MKKIFLIALTLLLIGAAASAETRIRCASTTSTQNSGLFDYLLPLFEKKTGIKVDVVAVGTGAAIEIGKRGDADVVLVHAREQEVKAVEEGCFVNRHDVMYNDFVIIGPSNDPARSRACLAADRCLQKDRCLGRALRFPRRQIGHAYQGTCALEQSRGSAGRPEVVPRSGPGHGEDPARRRRKTGVYAHRPGHLACRQGQGQTGHDHRPRRRFSRFSISTAS